jgi:hypothetical protein
MSILFESAIAHFGKAEHSLDDPDRMLDFGPHLRFGAVFRALDLIHSTAMAIAPVDEVFRSRCVLTDYCPLAAIRLIAPHAGFVSVQEIVEHLRRKGIGSASLSRCSLKASGHNGLMIGYTNVAKENAASATRRMLGAMQVVR